MKSYLLDTSTIINYLQGREDIVALLDSLDGELSSSYLCLSELYEGVYRAENIEKTEKIILNFFKTLSAVYTINEKVAKKFGEIRAELKTKGNVIEDIDIFIAATCLAHDLVLITGNVKHFSRISNLDIYSQNPQS